MRERDAVKTTIKMLNEQNNLLINKVVARTNMLAKIEEGEYSQNGDQNELALLLRRENIQDNEKIIRLEHELSKANARYNNGIFNIKEVNLFKLFYLSRFQVLVECISL